MIKYTVAEAKKPGTTEKIYFPKIVRASTLQMRDIEDLLQRRSTMTEGEIHALLVGLVNAIRFYVTNSFTVEVEGLGIFTPTIKAKAMNTPDEVNGKSITFKGVNYRPTPSLDTKLQKSKFIKARFTKVVE